MNKAMTAQRMRETAALLITAGKRYTTLAVTCEATAQEIENGAKGYDLTADQYRASAKQYRADAEAAKTAARELQEHSFTLKG